MLRQIQEINPAYRLQSLGSPQTAEGQRNQLDLLRFDRAIILLQVRGETKPLQVETLRFLQRRTDEAYAAGRKLLEAGKLTVRLSPQEAIGNFVDREVRDGLRERYNGYGIPMGKGSVVRVNSREYDTSGTDRSYRQPDSRVGDVAFDVTLTRKTLEKPQVRGFFAADFAPQQVVIIRPTQLGADSTYAITRPEPKR